MRISDWSSDVCSSDLLMRRAERCGAWKRRGWAILIFIIPAKAGSQRAEVATGFPLGSDDDDPATVGSRPLVRRLAGERMRSMAQADFNALWRSEEHTSELQSLMRISYAVFCLKKKKKSKH